MAITRSYTNSTLGYLGQLVALGFFYGFEQGLSSPTAGYR